MNKFSKTIIIFLLVFSTVHLFRDMLQIYQVNTPLATILKTNHSFCRPFCDYVTLPPEIFIIFASWFVLQRKKFGQLGWIIYAVFVMWMEVYIFYLIKETLLHL